MGGGAEGSSRAIDNPEADKVDRLVQDLGLQPPSLSFFCQRPSMFPAKSLSISGCDHRMGLGPNSLQSHAPLFVLSPINSTAAGAGRRLAEDVPRAGVCPDT